MADDSGRLSQVFAETSFLYGGNAAFIEDMHERWAKDPNSVTPAWRAFFEQLRDSADAVAKNAAAGSWGREPEIARTEELSALDGQWPEDAPAKAGKSEASVAAKAVAAAASPGVSPDQYKAAAHDAIRAMMLNRT